MIGRREKQWMILGGKIFLIIAVAFILEYISLAHNVRFNLSGSLKYELSERTKKVLSSLKDKVTITYFGPRNMPETELIRKMLDLYSMCSDMVECKVVDPKRNPSLAKRYNISPEDKIAVVEYKGRIKKVIVGSEEDLTNAILRLTSNKMKVYFLIRDGEYNPFDPTGSYSQVVDILKDENYVVKELKWRHEQKEIPEDADLVIIWRPKKEFSDEEISLLENYLKDGGRILFMIEPFSVMSLNSFLNKFGIAIKDDIVVDSSSRLIGGDMFMPMIFPNTKHPIVAHLGFPVMLPMVRPIHILKKSEDLKIILKTNPESWTISEKRYNSWKFEYKEGEGIRGQVPVAVSFEGKKGKMILIGCADFAMNSYLNLPGVDNKGLFINLVEWLCRGEKFLAERKVQRYSYRSLRENERKELLCIVAGMPAFVFFAGIAIYFRIKRLRV